MQEYTLDRNKVKISYKLSQAPFPDAPLLIFVHGTLQDKSLWERYGYTSAFSTKYQVLTFDIRGFGDSSKPHRVSDYAMKEFSEDIRQLLSQFAQREIHYIGFSLGARIGLFLALDKSIVFSSMVLMGCKYTPMVSGEFDKVFFPGAEDILRNKNMPEFLDHWEKHTGKAISDKSREKFLRHDPVAITAYLRACEHTSGIDPNQFSTITIPTLFITGELDFERKIQTQYASRLFLRGSYREIPATRHNQTPARAGEIIPLMHNFLDEITTCDYEISELSTLGAAA